MVSIFEYTDFRTYLRDYYRDKKEMNPRFSYELWTQKIGFTNRGFLFGVINGKKKISKLHCYKISQSIKHTKTEAEYFENITFYSQEENQEYRSVFLQKALQCKNGTSTPSQMIRKDQHEYLSKWYHSVVRALIGMYSFKDDKDEYEQLARRLIPPITAVQMKRSVKLLERLGFIVKDNDSTWQVTNKSINAGGEIPLASKIRFNLESNSLAKKSILNFSPETQHISSLILGISKDTYELICNESRMFKDKITELANNDKRADRVYEYHLAFFPVVKKRFDD